METIVHFYTKKGEEHNQQLKELKEKLAEGWQLDDITCDATGEDEATLQIYLTKKFEFSFIELIGRVG